MELFSLLADGSKKTSEEGKKSSHPLPVALFVAKSFDLNRKILVGFSIATT